ncbi:MAG: hypothetical protein KBC43_06595 [Bacteroidales bacterium]|nr:hypothetical protein [Bacteroidales bacterium]
MKKLIMMIIAFSHTYLAILNASICRAQDSRKEAISLEDYIGDFFEGEDEYMTGLGEWQEAVSRWLETPVCLNSDETEWLAEYRIIDPYQLSKLKEYRYIYGNLLSVYELAFIEGWDEQSARKVFPLVTVLSGNNPSFIPGKFDLRSFRQSLSVKYRSNSGKSRGYDKLYPGKSDSAVTHFRGSPAGIALRYDLQYRNRLELGIRMEKDPGEPMLQQTSVLSQQIKVPDLFSGFLHIKDLGLLKNIIVGNFRANFGYGLNLSGGQSISTGRTNVPGMAGKIRPQTSTGEAGFFRGAAVELASGRFSAAIFGSSRKIDGTTIIRDTLSGEVLSFSAISASGMHRTDSEMENRRAITETYAGGFGIFHSDWFKAGIFAGYNRFSAEMVYQQEPYRQFDFRGKENIIAGLAMTAWLKPVNIFGEFSKSIGYGMAYLAGCRLSPVPGASILVSYRHFTKDYNNFHGTGILSAGNNQNESGLRTFLRLELPGRWNIEALADISKSDWVSYTLNAPGRKWSVGLLVENQWNRSALLALSFRYTGGSVRAEWPEANLARTTTSEQYRIRISARETTNSIFSFNTRLECSLRPEEPTGWLLMQDIEIKPWTGPLKFWLRCSVFDARGYDNRIYAYENDVLYDFSTIAYYGKGVRGIFMIRSSLFQHIDLWVRFSTVYYADKYIGSGWDETGLNQQNEIEIQVRIRFPD